MNSATKFNKPKYFLDMYKRKNGPEFKLDHERSELTKRYGQFLFQKRTVVSAGLISRQG